MKLDEIIKLIDAGYTKEEIAAFTAEELVPEEKPEEAPAKPEESPVPAAAPADSRIDEAIAKLEKLSESMAKVAILNSQQPQQPSTDDYLATLINPK